VRKFECRSANVEVADTECSVIPKKEHHSDMETREGSETSPSFACYVE
jgi:hypothetical protein